MHEFGFWLAVGLVAIVALVLFKLLAASAVGQAFPAVAKLAAAA